MNEVIFEPIAFFAILACVFLVKSSLLLNEAISLYCDAIYVVPTPYNAQSKGIARELEIAEKNGIEILEV